MSVPVVSVAQLSRRTVVLLAGALLLLAWLVVDVVSGVQVSGLFCVPVLVVAVTGSVRWTTTAACAAVVAAVASGWWHDNVGSSSWALRLAGCAIGCAAAILVARRMEAYRTVTHHTAMVAQGLLDALAVELTGARTAKEVARGFLGRAADRLGASSGRVFLLDADGVMRATVWMGRGGPQADGYAEFSLDADLPGAAAVRERTARHYRDRAAIEAEFPRLRGYYPEDRSLHVLPLIRGDEPIGLLGLTFPLGVIATPEEEALLASFSGALVGALTRARELEMIDAATQRTQLLAEASLSLSRTLDVDSTVQEACRLLVPRFADWCAIDELTGGELELVALKHRDPETTAWAWSMRHAFPVDMAAPTGAPAVIRTGRSEVYPFLPRELVDAAAVSEEHAVVLRRLGLVSAVVAPLRGHDGTVVGAISLAHAESGRRYTPEDVPFVEDLASRIGLALDTAATFRKQTDRLSDVTAVAEAAQLAILAPPPPRIGSIMLSARYVGAAEEAHVGGDLYEVVQAFGRIRALIGDVCGKGLPAVRTATIVLGEFRAAATQEPDLAALAERLDAQMRRWLDAGAFVTACLVDIAPDGTFEAVSCGHPPPFQITGDHWQPLKVEPAPPLGFSRTPLPVTGSLDVGDRLLLYTDGLLEARTPAGSFFDPAGLEAIAAKEPFDEALDALLARLRAATSEHLKDDLALLLIGRDDEP